MSSGPLQRRARTLLLASLALVASSVVTATAAPGPDDTTTDHLATAMTLGAIADGSGGCTVDGAAREVVLPVSGISQRITGVEVGVTMTHSWLGDLTLTLVAPSGEEFVVLGRTGRTTATACGESANLDGTYVFSDAAETEWWATALPLSDAATVPSGTYRSSSPGGAGSTGAPTEMSSAFAGATASGTWTLRITDGGAGDTGAVTGAFLRLTVDTTAPQTVLNAGPAEGARLTTSPQFAFGSPDEGDLAGFTCQVGSLAPAVCSTPWVPPLPGPGAYTVRIAAVDSSGNTDLTPVTRSFVLRDLPCEAATAKVVSATKALAKAKKTLTRAKKSGKPAKIAKAKRQVKQKAAALKAAKARQRGTC